MSSAPAQDFQEVVEARLNVLQSYADSFLDHLYQKYWQHLQELEDKESEEANHAYASILAIERLRGYRRGEINAIREGY